MSHLDKHQGRIIDNTADLHNSLTPADRQKIDYGLAGGIGSNTHPSFQDEQGPESQLFQGRKTIRPTRLITKELKNMANLNNRGSSRHNKKRNSQRSSQRNKS